MRFLWHFSRASKCIYVSSNPAVLFRTLLMAAYKVEHDIGGREFFIGLSASAKAVLQYEKENDGILDLYHTEVPVSHRGQKIGALLAKAAMDYAVDKDLAVRLTCTYLQKYVKDNPRPEYESRIVKS